MKILIAEDRPEDRYLLEIILKDGGHQVTATANGKEALDRLKGEPFDFIISDVLMPEMDGYMFCRSVHADASLCRTPFVFLTATYLSDSDERFARQLGADGFIRKPVAPEDILRVIEEVTGRPPEESPPDKSTEEEIRFSQLHSKQILGALQNKSDELETLVQQLEQTQAALKVSEERYRLISASTSDYVYTVRWNKDDVLGVDWISGVFEDITGYHPREIKSLDDWASKVIPEDRKLFENLRERPPSAQTDTLEYRIRTAAGETVWLRDRSSPITDDLGRVVGRAGAVQDITQSKETDIHLKRLATAVDSAAESIVVTDADGRIQYVNPAFEKISGYASTEVLGRSPNLLKSGKHGRQFYRNMWRTLKNGNVWKGHITNRKKDGTYFEIEAVISPIKDDAGNITNFISVRRDVTREKALESQVQQAQKMEAIGTLAGGIAHDFNNILSAIIGFTELSIGSVADDGDLRENLNEVLRAGHRARDLVKQILTFARQTEHQDQPVDLRIIVKEVVKMLRASLPSTVEILNKINCDDKVMGDPTELHQVLMNICTNAAHAMPTGGELSLFLDDAAVDPITAELESQLNPGRYLRLTIGDTGCGMTPSQLGHIFEPFYTTKPKGEGTGLGLAVVHGIVQNHGGAIKVYSEPDAGSTFTIFLPVIEHDEQPLPIPDAHPLPRGNERILVVDDEPTIVNLTARMLTIMGYEVSAFTSGQEAMERFQAQPHAFDLVISDVTMPNITGDEIARRVMEIRPGMPVILCSGFTRLISETDAKALGIRALLTKPLFKSVLATTVRAAIDGHAD